MNKGNEEHFAFFYDTLMEDAPYGKWLEYTTSRILPHGNVLDLACGTGTLTILLAKAGYKVAGSDISRDMLSIAEAKIRESGQQVPLFHQDMRKLDGFQDLDGVTLFCDGLNYLSDELDVKNTFQCIYNSLKSGGVFLFDVHSPFKLEHVFNGQLYGEDRQDLTYLWFCHPGEFPLSVEHALTFFVKREDGTYERMDEELFQRTFPPDRYSRWLQEIGFHQIEITSNFGQTSFTGQEERIFFKGIK
ncbi:class I SAM-dependent DNA methyltransferase [Evansella tamaricis]|uniref:Class I SAM-dependent methyltransferase n=1 Tax=Evansella tamaricis TaxID=2069301 RepID=A0ABS6JI85_9BACI|nr:class I SAM-dependent methyltransferase [Evansella tamaricis]MBU9713380.1 class I SAM-dependent methyltransferase [Evansella tamaricis]